MSSAASTASGRTRQIPERSENRLSSIFPSLYLSEMGYEFLKV
jgi:hypothetical protein